MNLSNYKLTSSEVSVLSKGLVLCPTPEAPDIDSIIQDLDTFKRRERFQLFFSESNQDPSRTDTP